ncbi:ABC transporter permease [Mucilaginibacter sp. dw_454]|uniref:ABC transporter permease n=1 Tax=Mucilaginibacter sp. dw_454 TaxID=2720079 RepID=UPI001BD214B3|nr:ABC transporter permease [Mucilaginibacter sp. dw_454]
MIKNYLKLAWRSIIKRKFYSILNISGLAIAIGCGILIYLYTSYQLSFDRYHKHPENIFRVVYELHFERTEYDKGSSIAAYDALRVDSTYVQQAAVSVNNQSFIVNVNGDVNKRFKEDQNIAFTNSAWFKMFSYNWLEGNASQLDQPNTAALTQTQAKKYFGDADAVGHTLEINGQRVKVIGVLADAPYNTDLKSDIYLSFLSIKNLQPKIEPTFYTDWGYLNRTNSLFVSLTNPAQKATVEQQLTTLTKQRLGAGALNYYHFKLLPLSDMHFDMRYAGKVQKPLLVMLVIIGLLIIIIAGINYINLVIAGQTRRSVEIGTRKILGGSTGQLFSQFMIESLLNVLIAIVVAVVGVILVLPTVNQLLFDGNPVHILSYSQMVLFLAIILVVITIGTGIYPALLLSRANIFQALKNNVLNVKAGVSRRALVLLQNVVAQVLIISTIIIVMQVRFLKNTDTGFDRKFVVMVPVGDVPQTQKDLLRQRLQSIPGVQSLTFCSKGPSSDSQRGATMKFADRGWEKWPARFAIGDSAYMHTFGLHLLAGRNIRSNTPIPEYVANQTMVKMLHLKSYDEILGKKLEIDGKGIIVGVVKDFNVRSLLEPIEPSIILENQYLQQNVAIKLSGSKSETALAAIQKEYLHTFPDQVFSYHFIDDEIADLYKTQSLQQKLIWMASGIAVFISSLGLLGLISIITLHRTKEIGIRKVLGASVTQISMLLSKDFLVIVLVAMFISSPVAWWIMHKWLEGFAYRVEVQWWIFAVAGVLAIAIAFITVSLQSVKAALANPVDSLRNE